MVANTAEVLCHRLHIPSVPGGMNIRSVFRWLTEFANGGQNALLSKQVPGRPSKVTLEEMRWLANAIKDNTPLQHKFPFGLWTHR